MVHMTYSLNEHATTTTSRIIDGFTWFWIKDAYKQTYYRTRSIELTCLCLGVIGKFLQQHLVGITHQIGRVGVVAKIVS